MTEEFICKKHGFRTKDSVAAKKHVEGDMIDMTLELAGNWIKTRLGIPVSEPVVKGIGLGYDLGFCHCNAVPFPHKHAGAVF